MANNKIWSCMVQLGMAMWHESLSDTLVFDREMWKEWSEYLAKSGCNNILLDIGEGLVYDCHPELAAKNAFTKDEMKAEIKRLADLGIEIMPKLNFSTCHNMWMGKYSRMISSDEYYKFCEDIIDETCEIFSPRYFHLGMDEETIELEKNFDYVVLRQNDLWWHDLYHIVNRVESHGARAVIWADYARHKPDEFVAKLPKSVIPSVWYYFTQFENFHDDGVRTKDVYEIRVKPFDICNEHGFDQIPAGSNIYHRENLELLTRYCKEHIDDEHLLGIMTAPWYATTEEYRQKLFEAADTIKECREIFESMSK